jgi:hypothetical protein
MRRASPSWYQFLTIAGALTVNSLLIGGTLSLQDGTGACGAGAGGGDHRHRCGRPSTTGTAAVQESLALAPR